jgi:tetraacyldisaccharide 4'-kinase
MPVICVGNLVAGGSGKTPCVIHLAERLIDLNYRPAILSRGYGGQLAGPLRVDPDRHTAAMVGDEPIMMADIHDLDVWIAKDRLAGAKAIEDSRTHDVILLDDGLQHPHLAKDVSFIVIDGKTGLGNRYGIPAGPLRMSLDDGLRIADGIIIIGDDEHGVTNDIGLPVFKAGIIPDQKTAENLNGKSVIAFAGIGRPEKFEGSLRQLGAEICQFIAFDDHHRYRRRDIERLTKLAGEHNAKLVTTEKDLVRLPPHLRPQVIALPIDLIFPKASGHNQHPVDFLLTELGHRSGGEDHDD